MEVNIKMKNELSKQQKKLRISVYASLALVVILIFLGLVIMYFLSTKDMQLSGYTRNSLVIAAGVSVLGAGLIGKFWYIPTQMKYTEEFGIIRQLKKRTIVFIKIGAWLLVFLSGGIGIWYFNYHRSTQIILNAEPVKKYNTVTPLKTKTLPPNTLATITNDQSNLTVVPTKLLPLLEEFNVFEDGWNMYLDMMTEYGYTPPKGIE